MAEIPNLAGIATQSLVETIGGSSFKASYINWARTLHLLHEHAPGWLPELTNAPDGGVLHVAPFGAFLLIHFHHVDGSMTPDVPQAIMDTRNAAIPVDKITARDITDTHRRGTCMAAALTFGLAYELWAKMPLESGYAEPDGTESVNLWKNQTERKTYSTEIIRLWGKGDGAGLLQLVEELSQEQQADVWGDFNSQQRKEMKDMLAAAREAREAAEYKQAFEGNVSPSTEAMFNELHDQLEKEK